MFYKYFGVVKNPNAIKKISSKFRVGQTPVILGLD